MVKTEILNLQFFASYSEYWNQVKSIHPIDGNFSEYLCNLDFGFGSEVRTGLTNRFTPSDWATRVIDLHRPLYVLLPRPPILNSDSDLVATPAYPNSQLLTPNSSRTSLSYKLILLLHITRATGYSSFKQFRPTALWLWPHRSPAGRPIIIWVPAAGLRPRQFTAWQAAGLLITLYRRRFSFSFSSLPRAPSVPLPDLNSLGAWRSTMNYKPTETGIWNWGSIIERLAIWPGRAEQEGNLLCA
jgi:hypothetical protein